jgi:hypothetical protein
MHAFTQRVVARIGQADPEEIADALLDACEMLRNWRHFRGRPGRGTVGPFSDDEPYPLVAADDVEALAQAVVGFVRERPQHPYLCSAMYFFCYLRDPSTKDLIAEVLRDCLGRDSGTLYQAILALEALGENLYGPRTSTGYDEVERNERVARQWLLARRV